VTLFVDPSALPAFLDADTPAAPTPSRLGARRLSEAARRFLLGW